MDPTLCPECGAPAEILDRGTLESTSGPLEVVKIFCVRRHWFLLPVASLARRPVPAPAGTVPTPAGTVSAPGVPGAPGGGRGRRAPVRSGGRRRR